MSIEKRTILINEKEYPLNIHLERRNSMRVSVGKTGIHIRVPRAFSKARQQEEIEKLINWAVRHISRNPPKIIRKKKYSHLDEILIQERVYTIAIIIRKSRKNFASIKGDVIEFKIGDHHSETKRQAYISKQLQKILAEHYLIGLVRRVEILNEKYFRREVKEITFKYTKSRWGCCTSRKTINISTKLLLAPLQVLDYVIIHELAHLIEPNHSPRFWKLVRDIDPNYKEKTKWLKAHGHELVL